MIESVIDEGISSPLGVNGLRTEFALGGLSEYGLFLSPNGEALSLTGVPHKGVEFPLRPPMESKDPLCLYECCRFKVPLFDESSVEFDFRRLCLLVNVPVLV